MLLTPVKSEFCKNPRSATAVLVAQYFLKVVLLIPTKIY